MDFKTLWKYLAIARLRHLLKFALLCCVYNEVKKLIRQKVKNIQVVTMRNLSQGMYLVQNWSYMISLINVFLIRPNIRYCGIVSFYLMKL